MSALFHSSIAAHTEHGWFLGRVLEHFMISGRSLVEDARAVFFETGNPEIVFLNPFRGSGVLPVLFFCLFSSALQLQYLDFDWPCLFAYSLPI